MSRPERDITELPPETREIVNRLREAIAREMERGATVEEAAATVEPLLVGVNRAFDGDRRAVVMFDVASSPMPSLVCQPDLARSFELSSTIENASLPLAAFEDFQIFEDDARRMGPVAIGAPVHIRHRSQKKQRRRARRSR